MSISVVIGQPAEFECILKQRRDDLHKVELSPLAQTSSWMTIKSICERGRGRGWAKSTNKRRDHFVVGVDFFFISSERQVFTNAAKESTRSFHFAFPTRCIKVFVIMKNATNQNVLKSK